MQGKQSIELHHLHREQQRRAQSKNAFVTWQHFCDMAALCITSSTRCCCLSFIWWKQKLKIGSFQKKWQQCPPFLSFLFNVLAAGFLCFSSPVPASHYKYDEQNPPFPSLSSPPFDRTSPLLLLLSSHRLQMQKLSLSSWTTHKGVQSDLVNPFFCSNRHLSGHPGVPAADGGGVARGGGGGGGEHPPQLRPR